MPPGQTVALVGATGAGKSTFAKLVARFYDPTDGRVLVDGHDLREVAARSLRSQMGIVPQEAFLFSGTIADNIGFGRPNAGVDDIEAAARAVGAWDFIAALPEGVDTEVGERGVQLSAGQRQLVAFARALIADPRILVLDEATSNVDLRTESRIEAGLRRLLAGRTAIVIAHRLSTIRQAGRIVVLDQGRIVEQGTPRRAHRGRRSLRGAVRRLGGAGGGVTAEYAFRAPVAGDVEQMVAVTVDGLRDLPRRSRPRAGRRPRPPTRSSACGACSARITSGTCVAEHEGELVGHVGFLRRRPARVRAGRRPGARPLPPALRHARALGHGPRPAAARRGDRRGPRPRLHGDAAVHARPSRSARAASTSARAGS